ncbi:MAG: hypothetical protein K0S32_3033 [Bacteroidetes bacterium]|jgi:hypothetical protein|nr:hypothetical protein [Bacteroidota bacterium]
MLDVKIKRVQISSSDLSNPQIFKTPFILEKYTHNWPAATKWSPDFFAANYGTLTVNVTSCFNGDTKDMSIADYFSYFRENPYDDHFYYLKNWVFQNNIPELMDDYEVPSFFQSWTEYIPVEHRPKLRWLYIGPKGSGSQLHLDIVNSSAWNAVLSGRKKWHFFHPEQIPFLYGMEVDTFNPDLKKHPLYSNATPITCIQEPGDIVFTPSGWPHQVVNLESCISLTENFINASNFDDVLSYLEKENRMTEAEMLKELKNNFSNPIL